MAPDLADLIRRADGTDQAAAGEPFALLYDELHGLAEGHLRTVDGLTLTTSQVHETYLNMADRSGTTFPDRVRLFAYASRAMRGYPDGPPIGVRPTRPQQSRAPGGHAPGRSSRGCALACRSDPRPRQLQQVPEG